MSLGRAIRSALATPQALPQRGKGHPMSITAAQPFAVPARRQTPAFRPAKAAVAAVLAATLVAACDRPDGSKNDKNDPAPVIDVTTRPGGTRPAVVAPT